MLPLFTGSFESARWLLSQGKTDEAAEVLVKVAAKNNVKIEKPNLKTNPNSEVASFTTIFQGNVQMRPKYDLCTAYKILLPFFQFAIRQ